MMPSQFQIENAAGIDQSVAEHMMAQKTPAARSAMNLLQIQVNAYDPGGFAMLKAAVDDCKREMTQVRSEG